MPERVPPLADEVAAEILLRSEGIVSMASISKILFTVLAPQGVGPKVMEFDSVRLPAAFSRGADVRTACAVALEYSAAESGRNVAFALARLRLLDRV